MDIPDFLTTPDQSAQSAPEWMSIRTLRNNPPPMPTQIYPPLPSNRSNSTLVNQQFENMFEHILDEVSAGISIIETLRTDNRNIDPGMFFRWINRDPKRKQRFHEAQEIGSEVIAAEMVDIADAKHSIEDVQRSTLRINTRKFLIQSWNRKRYGESKQIEINQSISITDALSAANNRVSNIIDVTPEKSINQDYQSDNQSSHSLSALEYNQLDNDEDTY